MNGKFDIYEKITNDFIAALTSGIAPWHQPWFGKDWAVKHNDGTPYSLLNQMLLGKSGEWLSYSQIEKEGGRIKKGCKAHYVVFWKFLPKYAEDENGERIVIGSYPILKYYNVWHISETEGIKEKYPQTPSNRENDHIVDADKVYLAYLNRERENEDVSSLFVSVHPWHREAFYRPSEDYVEVPSIEQFETSEFYYSTLFHELSHSTGHKTRLNREGITTGTTFGSEKYSKEELIAEMSAAFICNTLGLNPEKTFDNSAAYVKGWLKCLKDDPKMVAQAASKAQQAAHYILTGEKPDFMTVSE